MKNFFRTYFLITAILSSLTNNVFAQSEAGIALGGFFLFLMFIAFGFVMYMVPLGLWISAMSSGAPVGLFTLIGMRLRKVTPNDIVQPRISAIKAGLNISVDQLEAHYLAGGNVRNVVNALISADKAKIRLTFSQATAIDLAGRDVLDAVRMSIKPRVITTPKVEAVAKDGIQLRAMARVTVRADLDKLVGGAGEETILARVGEGIVTTIGSAASHKEVIENPDLISRKVLERGLDAGTAFEILSIDVADVDIGKNVGAELQISQAQADKQIAQAKAESRRAMAQAQEQENKAQIQAMKAKLIEAESEIPQAISKALREGKMTPMDYYNMKNLIADTDMRKSISEVSTSSKQSGKK